MSLLIRSPFCGQRLCRFMGITKNIHTSCCVNEKNSHESGTKLTDVDALSRATTDLSHQRKSRAPLGSLSRAIATSHPTNFADEECAFMSTLSDILQDIKEINNKYNPEYISSWVTKCLEYNLPYGKRYRGMLTVQVYKTLVHYRPFKPETIRWAHILGWCVEILHAFILVQDDIMDNSTTRRGQTCWYKLQEVGFKGINDSVLMENIIFMLLKKYFRNFDCYLDLVELFHDAIYLTACGQCLDVLTATHNISTFDTKKLNAISINKSAYYTFYLPYALAMHLAGIKNEEAFRQAKTISCELGILYQMQDDFQDCYGDPQVTGKIGTDIQDNKCSWVAVECLRRADDKQKQILLECYGKQDPEMVQRVKELYTALNLSKVYKAYEEEIYEKIKMLIEKSSDCLPRDMFMETLNAIYKRDH